MTLALGSDPAALPMRDRYQPRQAAGSLAREATLLALAAGLPLAFNPFGTLAFEPFKVTLLRVAAGVLLLSWGVDRWRRNGSAAELRRPALAVPLVVAGGAYLLSNLVATIFSVNALQSLLGSYHRLQGLLTLVAAALVALAVAQSRLQLGRVADALVLGSIPLCFYALAQQFRLDPLVWLDRTLGPAGTIGSSTALGGYLAMLIPITLARVADAGLALRQEARSMILRRDWASWGYATLLVVLGLQTVTVFVSGVRGALLGMGVGLVVLALLLLLRGVGGGKPWMLLGGLVASLVIALALNAPGTPLSAARSASPYLERLGAINLDETSGRERLLIWRTALETWAASGPRMLVGFGPESQAVALEARFPLELANRLPDERFDRLHNDTLDVLLTTGVLGLVAYLGLIVAAFRAGWRSLWNTSDVWLAAALLAALAAHLVESALAFSSASTLLALWLLIGMLARVEGPGASESGRIRAMSRHAFRGQGAQWLVPVAIGLLVAALAPVVASPVLADLAFTRALAYRGSKNEAGEVAWLRRAAAMAPDRELYRVALGLALTTRAAAEAAPGGRGVLLSEAQTSLRQALMQAPGEPYVHFHLGQVLDVRAAAEQTPGRLTEAATAYDQAAAQSPSRALFFDAAGLALQRAGQPSEALARYRRALALAGPTAERVARIGNCQLALGNTDEAWESYQRALRLAPRSAVAHAGLAELFHGRGDLSAALEEARLAARFQFHEWQYREALARLEQEAEHPASALVEARAAARFAPPWERPRLRALVNELRRGV